MKKTTIFAVLLAAALLTGCGEDKPLDSTSSSSSSTSSSTTSSLSSSTSTSSTSSSTSSTSSSSSTTLSSSTAESSSSSTSSSSSSTSTPDPTQSTSSSTTSSTTPKPTQSSSSSSTPKPIPTQSTSTSSSFSSHPSTDLITDFWNPNAPGNKPGPYGGYYDASGNLHCKTANMPTDDKGYPLISYYRETGAYIMTYAENQKYIEEERRISAGGQPDLSDIDWSLFP